MIIINLLIKTSYQPTVSNLKLRMKRVEEQESSKCCMLDPDSASHRKNIVSIARRNLRLHQKLNEVYLKPDNLADF